MNVDNRFQYEPAYLRFYRFLRLSTLVAREQFVRDGQQIKAQWKALRPGNFVPTDRLHDYETSFIVARLIERAPVMEPTP